MPKLTRAEYNEHMDDLMFRVLAILDGEASFDVAGIGFGLIIAAMENMPEEGRARVREWVTQFIAKTDQISLH